MGQIQLGDITISIEKKNIRNINLKVYPPHGEVRITAPYRVNQETLRTFAQSKLEWIKKQQTKVRSVTVQKPAMLLNGEIHYFIGERYTLQLVEAGTHGVQISGSNIILYTNAGMTAENRQKLLDQWYRGYLRKVLPELINKWEGIMMVKVPEFGIKKMKTRWGTCNRKAGRIWLNLELAKKPPDCLEYVVVHEMTHLLEKNHNKQFYSLLDEFYPHWRSCKAGLSIPQTS